VLRPLVGMDKLEITAQARSLGTFEISIEPDADCCTLFVPKHPGTALRPEDVDGAERRLDVARLVEMGVEGAQEEHFDFPAGAGPFPPRPPRRTLLEQPARE
jgi:thiamine biosynthesis protein ThiI